MKTKFFVKTAVVAMAAFGAFAFNGNTQENDQYSYKKNDQICTNLSVGCDNLPGAQCQVRLKDTFEIVKVWDLNCTMSVTHSISEILNEN